MIGGWERGLVAAGALSGLAGIGLSALAAHATGPGSLEVAARFLLMHAPVFLAIGALFAAGLLHRAIGTVAAMGLAVGLTLFAGDLAFRALAGSSLARLAAPVGGVVLMAGWAALGVAALVGPRHS